MNVSWQSRLVHDSTGNAADNPCCLRSYTPSTRSDGVSLRQNVTFRVLVPVVESATFGARPASDIEGQTLDNVMAFRAALGARKEAVDDPEFLAVPSALVSEHLAEGAHADIGNASGKLPVEHHVPHAQVLDADDIVASQIGRASCRGR